MKTKKCEECGIEFTAKRDDAKFCSSTCRSNYWKKGLTKTEGSACFKTTLKGLINDSDKPIKTISESISNKQYHEYKAQLANLNQQIQKVENEINNAFTELNQISNPENINVPLVAAGTGALLGFGMKGKEIDDSKRFKRTIWGGVIGLVSGKILEQSTKELIEKNRQQRVVSLNVSINSLNVKLIILKNEQSQVSGGRKIKIKMRLKLLDKAGRCLISLQLLLMI